MLFVIILLSSDGLPNSISGYEEGQDIDKNQQSDTCVKDSSVLNAMQEIKNSINKTEDEVDYENKNPTVCELNPVFDLTQSTEIIDHEMRNIQVEECSILNVVDETHLHHEETLSGVANNDRNPLQVENKPFTEIHYETAQQQEEGKLSLTTDHEVIICGMTLSSQEHGKLPLGPGSVCQEETPLSSQYFGSSHPTEDTSLEAKSQEFVINKEDNSSKSLDLEGFTCQDRLSLSISQEIITHQDVDSKRRSPTRGVDKSSGALDHEDQQVSNSDHEPHLRVENKSVAPDHDLAIHREDELLIDKDHVVAVHEKEGKPSATTDHEREDESLSVQAHNMIIYQEEAFKADTREAREDLSLLSDNQNSIATNTKIKEDLANASSKQEVMEDKEAIKELENSQNVLVETICKQSKILAMLENTNFIAEGHEETENELKVTMDDKETVIEYQRDLSLSCETQVNEALSKNMDSQLSLEDSLTKTEEDFSISVTPRSLSEEKYEEEPEEINQVT